MNNKNHGNSIEIIAKLVLEKWYVGVSCVLACILVVVLYTNFLSTHKFLAYTTMYVTSDSPGSNGNNNDESRNDTTTELAVNEMLAKDYTQIAISNSVLLTASENLGGVHIPQNDISIRAYPDTRVLRLSVVSKDAILAARIANEITECLIDKIKELTDNDNIKIIDRASVPESHMPMPIGTYLTLAVILGIVLDVIMIMLFEVFDTKVKGPEDFKEKFNIPILALIPKYDINGRDAAITKIGKGDRV